MIERESRPGRGDIVRLAEDLSSRCSNNIARSRKFLGIDLDATFEDLAHVDLADLMKIRGFGPLARKELLDAFARRGIKYEGGKSTEAKLRFLRQQVRDLQRENERLKVIADKYRDALECAIRAFYWLTPGQSESLWIVAESKEHDSLQAALDKICAIATQFTLDNAAEYLGGKANWADRKGRLKIGVPKHAVPTQEKTPTD